MAHSAHPHTAHVSNAEVRARTDQPPITTVIKQRRFKLFGHVARADLAEDHSHALASLNLGVAKSRTLQTWQRTINDDLSHLHLGQHTFKHKIVLCG